MFEQAYSFNQNISGWDVSNVTDTIKMFDETEELSDSNKFEIHTSFSSNNNWSYVWWESYCSESAMRSFTWMVRRKGSSVSAD